MWWDPLLYRLQMPARQSMVAARAPSVDHKSALIVSSASMRLARRATGYETPDSADLRSAAD